jgi:predicted permease
MRPEVPRRWLWLYRAMLRAYPGRFRERHGAEMERLFADRSAEARARGPGAVAKHWAATVSDVARNGVAERVAGGGGGGDGAGPGRDAGRRGDVMGGVWRDVRYAVRTLARNPGFALIAVLTIAVGIGANTAIFSVVRAVLLRPLPYATPDRLAVVSVNLTNRDLPDMPLSPLDFRDFEERTRAFDAAAAAVIFPQSLVTAEGEPVQVQTGGVTHDFLDLLGVAPALGRGFAPEDAAVPPPDSAQNAGPLAALLAHGIWRDRFGGDPEVVGRSIELGGNRVTVVGVLPEGFRLLFPPSAGMPTRADVWTPMRLDPDALPRGNLFLRVVARLAPGVTPAQARTDLERISAHLRDVFPGWETAGLRLEATGLHDELVADVRPMILALLGAVGFLLLVACANVANLLLVRGSTRSREIAVRAAVGGSRRRILRQLVSESGVLALAGAVLGVVIAAGGIRLLLWLQPPDVPRLETVTVDGMVLGFTAAAAVVAALAFGVVPALRASRADLGQVLKTRGAGGGGGHRLRNGVVVAEVALSIVLLVGAGLMVRSFAALQRVEPGYDPGEVLTFNLSLPNARYATQEERAGFALRLKDRLEAIPGVERVGAAFPLPLTGAAFNGRYGTEAALSDPTLYRQADYRMVVPGYFEAMGTRVLAGRTFTRADFVDSAAVAVIDDALARRLWPGQSPVGRTLHVRVSSPDPQTVEVIGVVEHQRSATLAREGPETVYFTARFTGLFGISFVVRTAGDPRAAVPGAREALASLDPTLPLGDVRTMASYVDESMASTRFALALIGVFGLTALLLAAVGLYGTLAYAVRQRHGELGVRVAFGAARSDILGLVLRQGLILTGLGIALGSVAALGLTRALTSLLVEVTPTDPATFVGIGALFLVVATGASLVPARRALRVDPVTALREDG